MFEMVCSSITLRDFSIDQIDLFKNNTYLIGPCKNKILGNNKTKM